MNKLAFSIKEDKQNVQAFYVNIIFEALEKLGYKCLIISNQNKLSNIPKDSLHVAISHYSLTNLYFKGYRNTIYWIQGSSPDESFMRNKSYIRKFIISCIERFSLSRALFCFMVSGSMLKHFNKKYNKDFSFKTYIMPCYNSEIYEHLFHTPNKYNDNIFCYVGGLSAWQCFIETTVLYKQIEEQVPNSKFKVFTPATTKAESILEANNVKNYDVKYVTPDQLVGELASCKYGFIIRSESPVNYVATPTKLSNYMAAGLIPIVSNTVGFFGEILEDVQNAVVLNGICDTDKIISFSEKQINADDVYGEFKCLFKKFYNTEEHINNIANRLGKILF